MRIFMSGGTGFVGGHLRRALLKEGHRIRLLVHGKRGAFEPGVEPVTGDVGKAAEMAPLMEGCEAAINLIGIIREFPGRGVTFEKLHVETTKTMITAATKAGIRRYLQMSALGTRPDAVSRYHRTKYAAEELVRTSGLDYTIFRPSIIHGPDDAFVSMLATYIRTAPAVPVIGDGRYRLQPISADDVARCFVEALGLSATIGATYEIGGPDQLSYLELLDTIGRVLGKTRVTKIHAPLSLMKLIVPFLQRFPLFPLTMDQLQMLVEENICSNDWQKVFGFQPTGFEEGLRTYLRP